MKIVALLVLVYALYLVRRGERNLRQVENEMAMRRGFKRAARNGWIKHP